MPLKSIWSLYQPRSCFMPAVVSGGVVVDAPSITNQYKSSAGTQTLTGVTVAAGSNLALIVTVGLDQGSGSNTPTVVSLTWDVAGANQPLSFIKQANSTTLGADAQLWGLVGVTPGTNKTITLVTTGSSPVFLSAVALSGVDQTGSTTTFSNATSANSATSVTVTSAVGDLVVSTGYSGAALGTLTGTQLYKDEISGAVINSYANYDSGASPTRVIGTSATKSGLCAVDVKAA